MTPSRIYLLHPANSVIQQWIEEVREVLREDKKWKDRQIISLPYDSRNSFRISDVCARVGSVNGPVILLEKVQTKPREQLRELLRYRTIVSVCSASCSDDIYQAVLESLDRFEDGEPHLPRKLVAAILIVKKLYVQNYWAGRDKGYVWGKDIKKGRGIPAEFVDIVDEVVNDLLNKGVLISKKSCGKTKYALNKDRRIEISSIVEKGHFHDDRLYNVLTRDKKTVPSRFLSDLEIPQELETTSE